MRKRETDLIEHFQEQLSDARGRINVLKREIKARDIHGRWLADRVNQLEFQLSNQNARRKK